MLLPLPAVQQNTSHPTLVQCRILLVLQASAIGHRRAQGWRHVPSACKNLVQERGEQYQPAAEHYVVPLQPRFNPLLKKKRHSHLITCPPPLLAPPFQACHALCDTTPVRCVQECDLPLLLQRGRRRSRAGRPSAAVPRLCRHGESCGAKGRER